MGSGGLCKQGTTKMTGLCFERPPPLLSHHSAYLFVFIFGFPLCGRVPRARRCVPTKKRQRRIFFFCKKQFPRAQPQLSFHKPSPTGSPPRTPRTHRRLNQAIRIIRALFEVRTRGGKGRAPRGGCGNRTGARLRNPAAARGCAHLLPPPFPPNRTRTNAFMNSKLGGRGYRGRGRPRGRWQTRRARRTAGVRGGGGAQ